MTDTFRQLNYAFDYGETGLGNWPLSGLNRNVDTGGPIGSHVYETPGTYTVRCTATRGASSHFQEVSVTVTSQDAAFPGTATICVSPSGNYAGAPAGAATQTTIPNPITANTRVLLRRGEAHGAINIADGASLIRVGAFGSGARPTVTNISLSPGRLFVGIPQDVAIQDVESLARVQSASSIRQYTLLRLHQENSEAEMDLVGAIIYWAMNDPSRVLPRSSFQWPDQVFVQDCFIQGNPAGPSAFNFYGAMSRSAVMGCQIGIATQHSIRQILAHQVRFSHNWLRGMSGEGAQHAMKMQSNGLAAWRDNPFQDDGYTACASRYVISTDNLMGDWNDTNFQTDTWRPENGGGDSGQGIEDVIIERNTYRRGPNTNGDLLLVGRRMTYLDNVRDGGGVLAVSVLNPGDALYGLLPAEWRGPYFTSRD